jgi:hypothetical protein
MLEFESHVTMSHSSCHVVLGGWSKESSLRVFQVVLSGVDSFEETCDLILNETKRYVMWQWMLKKWHVMWYIMLKCDMCSDIDLHTHDMWFWWVGDRSLQKKAMLLRHWKRRHPIAISFTENRDSGAQFYGRKCSKNEKYRRIAVLASRVSHCEKSFRSPLYRFSRGVKWLNFAVSLILVEFIGWRDNAGSSV